MSQVEVTTCTSILLCDRLLLLLNAGQLRLPSSTEIVLEYIIERKRMDDLAGSIIDRRFQEQKVWATASKHPTLLLFDI